jgi:hypothetical protein
MIGLKNITTFKAATNTLVPSTSFVRPTPFFTSYRPGVQLLVNTVPKLDALTLSQGTFYIVTYFNNSKFRLRNEEDDQLEKKSKFKSSAKTTVVHFS